MIDISSLWQRIKVVQKNVSYNREVLNIISYNQKMILLLNSTEIIHKVLIFRSYKYNVYSSNNNFARKMVYFHIFKTFLTEIVF